MSKKVIISPQNEEDDKCFKWAVIAALHHEEIGNNPQRISKLRRFEDDYEWGGLEFSFAINKIDIFDWKNIFVNVLAIEGGKKKLYILRKAKFDGQRTANLLLIANDEKRHYASIKNLSQLLVSSNSDGKRRKHLYLKWL